MENNETRYSHSRLHLQIIINSVCQCSLGAIVYLVYRVQHACICQIYESSMDAQSNESDASIVIFSIASRSYMLHTHSYLLQQNQRTKCPIVRDVFFLLFSKRDSNKLQQSFVARVTLTRVNHQRAVWIISLHVRQIGYSRSPSSPLCYQIYCLNFLF